MMRVRRDDVPQLRRECGTLTGWQAHYDAGERACQLCRKVKGIELRSAIPPTVAHVINELTSGTAVQTWFRCRFDSHCQRCGEPMATGARIARTFKGEYICGECAS